jgi:hypothetical protein
MVVIVIVIVAVQELVHSPDVVADVSLHVALEASLVVVVVVVIAADGGEPRTLTRALSSLIVHPLSLSSLSLSFVGALQARQRRESSPATEAQKYTHNSQL